jgi:hypothetical protein
MIYEGALIVKWFLLPLISAFIAFFGFMLPILTNAVPFHPDEFYWAGTARVIPAIQSGSFSDQIFSEPYGYANFNGAKYLYGFGNQLARHDLSFIGYPPDTYYRFSPYGTSFPEYSPAYGALRDARIVSALFASIAVGLLSFLALLFFGDPVGSSITSAIFFFHPVFHTVGMQAFSDSMFICCQLLVFVCLELYRRIKSPVVSFFFLFLASLSVAYLASIKINGALFLAIILYYCISKNEVFSYNPKWIRAAFEFVHVVIVSSIVFLVLQFNYFMPGSISIWHALETRIAVTVSQVQSVTPEQVLVTIPSRLTASVPALFGVSPMGILFIVTILFLLLRRGNVPRRYAVHRLCMVTFIVYSAVIFYFVFNEPRYLLPFLPLFAILAGYPFTAVTQNSLLTEEEDLSD